MTPRLADIEALKTSEDVAEFKASYWLALEAGAPPMPLNEIQALARRKAEIGKSEAKGGKGKRRVR